MKTGSGQKIIVLNKIYNLENKNLLELLNSKCGKKSFSKFNCYLNANFLQNIPQKCAGIFCLNNNFWFSD
jgi:hypothetical protein